VIAKNEIMDEKSISVYDIKQWATCPRQLYFKKTADRKGKAIVSIYENPAFFEKALYRELLFAVPDIVLQSISEQKSGSGIDEKKLKRLLEETAGEITEEMLSLMPEADRGGTGGTGTGTGGAGNAGAGSAGAGSTGTGNAGAGSAGAGSAGAGAGITDTAEDKNKTGGENGEANPFRPIFPNEKTEQMTANALLTAERHGTALYESAAFPFSEEKMYYSQKLNLYGTPAKVLLFKEKMLPYMIRLSKPPQNGVWENDRITAAAYNMILKNEYGQENVSENAAADYFGELRLFQIRAADKRKVFRAMRKIKDIQNGKMPDEKNIRLCKHCLYKETCQPRLKSIFSKLFE